jgi:hypothetical protein
MTEIQIEKLGAKGDGVAILDGTEVFAPYTVPANGLRVKSKAGVWKNPVFWNRSPFASKRPVHISKRVAAVLLNISTLHSLQIGNKNWCVTR